MSLVSCVDYSQTWGKLPPLPRPQDASGIVGHVESRRHPSFHQGVVSAGGCACHFLQTAKGHNLVYLCHESKVPYFAYFQMFVFFLNSSEAASYD